MGKLLKLIVILALNSGIVAKADLPAELEELFTTRFHKNYAPRQCGKNILDFIEQSESKYRAADQLFLVKVETSDELIQAEQARGSKRPDGSVGDQSWYFHVFALDKAGNVYDFDFTDEPKVVPLHEYIEKMFLNDDECLIPKRKWKQGDTCIGSTQKLIKYYVTVMPGEKTLGRDRPPSRQLSFRELLNNWHQAVDW